MANEGYISTAAWAKGIGYSILASIVGGASKLLIRKSWLVVQEEGESESSTNNAIEYDENGRDMSSSRYNNIDNEEYDDFGSTLPKRNSSDSLCQRHNNEPYVDGDQFEDNERNEQEEILATVEEKLSLFSNKHILARALRYTGMFGMTFLNPLFCVLAMNYASPSILAPFSGLTLVWIILFSDHFISEKPQSKQIFAAGLIILGQIVVGVFGDHTNDDDITLDDVVESYKQWPFQLFFVGQILWLSFLAYLMVNSSSPKLRRLAWGVTSGTVTGFQNFLKDSLSVIKACEKSNEPLPWYLFILISLAALTAFSGLLILTRCMKRYDVTFSSAMFVGSFIISASIMANIHYHTFSNLTGFTNFIMYPVGLLILMIGLYLLVQDTKESELVESIHHNNDNDDEYQSEVSNTNQSTLRLPLVSMRPRTSEQEEDGHGFS